MLPSELPEIGTGVAFDTETSGLYPDSGATVSTVSVAWRNPDGQIDAHAWGFDQGVWGKPEEAVEIRLPVPYAGAPGSKYAWVKRTRLEIAGPNTNLPEDEWDALCGWFGRHDLVAHNALFDLLLMQAGTRKFPGVDLSDRVVWDTFLGQKVLDPMHPLGLKPATERIFGMVPEEKDALIEHLRKMKCRTAGNPRYDLAEPHVILPYAADDTRRTIKLARHQWLRFRDGEAKWLRLQFEMDVMHTLRRMERRGVPYDVTQSRQWAAKIQSRIEEMVDSLPFGDTPTQVRQYYFGSGTNEKGNVCLELKPTKVTAKKKEPCIDAEVMRELADRKAPGAQLYQEYALLGDANSRYYQGYAEFTGTDGRLRTRFRQAGTRSGRLSCERTNLQAIPHDHRMLASGSEVLAAAPSPRDLIHPIEGYELYELDLKQAELRVAALYAQCKPMLEIIYENRDPHGETAIGLNLSTPGAPNWDQMRGVGKRGNFSLIFGIGHLKFRADLRKQVGVDLGARATQKLVGDWNKLYPEFKRTLDRYLHMAQKDGWTYIRDDVRRYYSDLERGIVGGRQQPWDDLYKAFNQKVQGSLGEFGKTWMVKADAYLMDQGVDAAHAGVLLQIHDSLVVMVPIGRLDLVAGVAAIAEEMWPLWFDVPGGVDTKQWQKH